MHRVAALILCCTLLVVAAVVAAPAPFPTRAGRASGPWVDGWDSPVNPRGDCRFDRRGDRLTITVPGSERGWDSPGMLLRDVEGDFVVRVYIGGQVRQGEPYCREAGLPLAAGQWRLCAGVCRGWLDVTYNTEDGQGQHSPTPFRKCHTCRPGEGFWLMEFRGEEPVLLQLRRRGDEVEVSAGLADSSECTTVATLVRPLPRRLKLGVYAQATDGGIAAEFSQFKLTRSR